MEEINLDLESNNHKNISINSNISNGSNKPSNISIFKDTSPKESNIGIDLLINKSKTGGSDQFNTNEFKPSDPISYTRPRTDSIESGNNITMNLNDIGDSNSPPRNSISQTPNINLELENNEIDINLDDLFNEDSTTKSTNILDDIKLDETKINSNNSSNSHESPFPKSSEKTYEELQNEKAEYIRLLERLDSKGVHSHIKFNMNSDYNEVKNEFDRLTRQRECDKSVKFQKKMLIAFVTAVEFLNTKFDPFDVKLEGWSENVHENATDYDDIFEELHEKYQSKSKMAPELKLLLTLGGSGFMFHLTNTMFKTSLPGMDDVMRQNPDLMRQFASATANSMEQKNKQQNGSNSPFSGLGNLMSGLMVGNLAGGPGGSGLGGDKGRQIPRREMDGPPDINDILNNMNGNKVDIDMNSNYSESDMEGSRNIHVNKNKRSLNLDI
jgi:hypothetical protein